MKKKFATTILLAAFSGAIEAHPGDLLNFMHDAQRQVIAPYTCLVNANNTLAYEIFISNDTPDTFDTYLNTSQYNIILPYSQGNIYSSVDFDEIQFFPYYAYSAYYYELYSNYGLSAEHYGYDYISFSGLYGLTDLTLYIYD